MSIRKIYQIANPSSCVACGTCADKCPLSAIIEGTFYFANPLVCNRETCGYEDLSGLGVKCAFVGECPQPVGADEIDIVTNQAITYEKFVEMMGNYDEVSSPSKTSNRAYKHEDYLDTSFIKTPMSTYLDVSNKLEGHVPTYDDLISNYVVPEPPSAYTVTYKAYRAGTREIITGGTFFSGFTINDSSASINSYSTNAITDDRIISFEDEVGVDITYKTTFRTMVSGESLGSLLNPVTVPANSKISYTASCSGYTSKSGTATITGDTTISVYLNYTGGTITPPSSGSGETTTYTTDVYYNVARDVTNLGNFMILVTSSDGSTRYMYKFNGGSGVFTNYYVGDEQLVASNITLNSTDKIYVLMGNKSNTPARIETGTVFASVQFDSSTTSVPENNIAPPNNIQLTETETSWMSWYTEVSNLSFKSGTTTHKFVAKIISTA